MIVFFNVAHLGQHVFRTDKQDSREAERTEATLREAFPATQGYSVDRYSQDGIWTVRDINAAR